jgi:molybdenum cofactor cytidylyltransferase
MNVVVVLAAGLSRRFPGNKLLYHWNNSPIIRHTLKNILHSRVDRIVLVTGHMKEEILRAIEGLDDRIDIVYNRNYREGMSSSVRAGVEHIINNYDGVEAIMFTPGDCAWIKPVTYDLMIEYLREKIIVKPAIIIPVYNERKGHPILFIGDLLEELLNVSEETRGLKNIVKRYNLAIRYLVVNDPGTILDLDNYNDLNRVKYTVKK